MSTPTIQDLLLHHEVSIFLAHEAEHVDSRRFEQWADLFTEDARYVAPLRMNRTIHPGEDDWGVEKDLIPGSVPYFDENAGTLKLRAAKLRAARSPSENPASRTRHFVTNIRVATADSADAYHVKSNLLVYQSRGDSDVYWFSAERTDTLRRVDGNLKIASREIFLDSSVLLSGNLSIFF